MMIKGQEIMTDERERNMDKRRKKENKWERIESCKIKM